MSAIGRSTLRAARAGRIRLSQAPVVMEYRGAVGIQAFRQSLTGMPVRHYSSPVLSAKPIPIVTYEQLKPLTQQPSLVGRTFEPLMILFVIGIVT